MSRSNRTALIMIIVFLAIFLSVLTLNRSGIEARKALLEKSSIELVSGKEIYTIGLQEIEKLKVASFQAVLDTSSSQAKTHEYSGVQISDILEYMEIDLEGSGIVIITGADGFSVGYSIEEVLKDGNVYLVYKEDGEYLGGIDDGGRGPYETIIISDQFSNRRCKWVTRIEVTR